MVNDNGCVLRFEVKLHHRPGKQYKILIKNKILNKRISSRPFHSLRWNFWNSGWSNKKLLIWYCHSLIPIHFCWTPSNLTSKINFQDTSLCISSFPFLLLQCSKQRRGGVVTSCWSWLSWFSGELLCFCLLVLTLAVNITFYLTITDYTHSQT